MTIKEKLALMKEMERRNRDRLDAWKKQQAK